MRTRSSGERSLDLLFCNVDMRDHIALETIRKTKQLWKVVSMMHLTVILRSLLPESETQVVSRWSASINQRNPC